MSKTTLSIVAAAFIATFGIQTALGVAVVDSLLGGAIAAGFIALSSQQPLTES